MSVNMKDFRLLKIGLEILEWMLKKGSSFVFHLHMTHSWIVL